MLKRLVYVLSFLTGVICLNAQQANDRAAFIEIRNSSLGADTKADSLYFFLARVMQTNEPLADSLSGEMRRYGEELHNKTLVGYAALAKALLVKKQDNYANGISMALEAIALLDSVKQLKRVCEAYQTLAHLYSRTNNFELSGEAALKSLSLAEASQDPKLLFDTYNFLGLSLIGEKKFDEARQLYRKAMRIAEKNQNLSQLTRVYTNLGIAFRNLQEWDSAFYYHHKSYAVALKSGSKYDVAFTLNDIGVIYLRTDDYGKALEYLLKSATIREEIGEKWELGFTYNFIGECYADLDKMAEAENYIRKAIAISYLSKNVRQRYESYDYLSIIKSVQSQYDSAFYFVQKHTALKDSFQRARNNLMTEALIASYQTKEKEKEIALLNEVSTNQSLEIQRQRLYLIIAVVVSVFVVSLAVLILRSRKQAADKLRLESQLKEESIKRIASESIQREKERISRDLHDNVGGQLSFVLYSLDGIEDDDKTRRAELSKSIGESVRTVIGNLRETIWALNDEFITIQDLSDKLKVYARGMFKNTPVRLVFKESIESQLRLKSAVGLNVFRICQEAVNNGFKHSGARNVTIEVLSGSDGASVSISDDGRGFDVHAERGDTFGLVNMQARAKEAGITVEIRSDPASGTRVTLVV